MTAGVATGLTRTASRLGAHMSDREAEQRVGSLSVRELALLRRAVTHRLVAAYADRMPVDDIEHCVAMSSHQLPEQTPTIMAADRLESLARIRVRGVLQPQQAAAGDG